ncbi:MAG TPA: CxxC-x17-CxxC domain-containing protein [Candidatus Paceibacterota bacterium]
MTEFKKNNRFSGGDRRPFHKGGDNRSQGQRELYDAECNSCHKKCQVPFRPNGRKPVYCSDCFKQDDDRAQKPRFEKREYTPSRAPIPSAPDPRIDGLKRQLDTVTATLEKLVVTVESMNRADALTKEVRKHIPATKPAPAPKKVAVKKAVKKAVKRGK